jgi:5'-nucleotidase (lipoprotein e(P4) family)
VPGALEFLRHCDTVGVAVFYISNRKNAEREGTFRNLRALGFPQVQEDHVLFRTNESSKRARRARVAETHSIVMLCGDNLADFHEVFENGTVASRAHATDSAMQSFGTEYIVLPNPMYGDWYGALIHHDYSLPWQAQEQRRLEQIRGF